MSILFHLFPIVQCHWLFVETVTDVERCGPRYVEIEQAAV